MKTTSVCVFFGLLISALAVDSPAPPQPERLSEVILAGARANDPAKVRATVERTYTERGSFDEPTAKDFLDGLVRDRELSAFTLLLDELRQSSYGKDWQPDDALLDGLVRDNRTDFLDALLARKLDLERLTAAGKAGNPETAGWIAKRVDEVRRMRSNIDALVSCAGSGDLENMKRLLDAGFDINGVSTNDWTPLTKAARESQVEAVRLLLARGAQVDKVRYPGWDYTPLCLTRKVEIAELLKAAGADVHAKLFGRNVSILTYICNFAGGDMVEWMLKQGLDPKMIGDHQQNLLFDAGDVRTVEILLAAGVDPNHVDEFGRTPLSRARSSEIAQKLINAGAKVPENVTEIGKMIGGGAPAAAIELVIKKGAKLDFATAQKALISAAHMDHAEIAEMLLRNGAKPNEPGVWGSNPDDLMWPLEVCAVFDSRKTAKVLLDHGADPNVGKRPGMLLQTAVQNRFPELARMLRDAGAKGVSDLAFALAVHDEPAVTQLLASAPTYAEKRDFWQEVLRTAACNGHLNTIRVALEKGVPMEEPPERSGYEAAAWEGQHEVLKEMLDWRAKTNDTTSLHQALWAAVWNAHPYPEQRPAPDFERCVELLLAAGALKDTSATGDNSDLVTSAVFTRYPGGSAKVFEMLVTAGLDPNPITDKDKHERLSDSIQTSCDKGNCSIPSASTLAVLERLGNITIKRK